MGNCRKRLKKAAAGLRNETAKRQVQKLLNELAAEADKRRSRLKRLKKKRGGEKWDEKEQQSKRGLKAANPFDLRQLAKAKEMSVLDCARFMALVAVAAADAGIAVFDAKYQYDFWRPMTAIRNGDIDDESALGTAEIPEVSMTSPTGQASPIAWTNIQAYNEEVSHARIWAGFHYRFSVRVDQDMGRKVGRYVVDTIMQPATR
jgi:hypothetical protein